MIDQISPELCRHSDARPLAHSMRVGTDKLSNRGAATQRGDNLLRVHPWMVAKKLSAHKGENDGKSSSATNMGGTRSIPPMPKPKNPLHVEVAARVRAAMADSRVPNAAELARSLKIEHTRAKNWQNGQSVPTLVEMVKLAEFFNVTLDWLIRGRAEGLPEDKRIRLLAIQSGLTPPSWAGTDWAVTDQKTGQTTLLQAKQASEQEQAASSEALASSKTQASPRAAAQHRARVPARQS